MKPARAQQHGLPSCPSLVHSVSLALLLASITIGCAQLPIEHLPAYDHALGLAPRAELRCYEEQSLDGTQLPQLVPYATVATSYDRDKKYATRALVRQVEPTLHPDIIVLFEGGKFYAGSVSSASAFPVGTGAIALGFSTPVYARALNAVCFRLAPVMLGFRWDESGMIVLAAPEALASGLLEGDRIISIADAPVTLGARSLQSAHFSKLLGLRPGEKARIVWIRPGTGRMEGELLLQENQPSHLDLPGMDLSPPPPMRDY